MTELELTAAKAVGVMIMSMKNWTSVANYVKLSLKLKKRDLDPVEHLGVPA